jgi:DNA-binding transcriptional ArsR family regulator
MADVTRHLPHPELAEVELSAVLFALSDPARLELVRELADRGPLTVAQCQATGGPEVPKSTFSHQLKTLREAGVVRNEPAGRQRTVTLRRAEIDERFPGLLDAVLGAPPRRLSRSVHLPAGRPTGRGTPPTRYTSVPRPQDPDRSP